MIARCTGLLFVLAVCFMAMGGEARAWTPFGTQENIHRIANVDLKGPDGVALFIGYKTSTNYFLGGVSVSDDGYVLGLQADKSRFLDMPPPDKVAEFQAQGLLPNPLPSYSLDLGDYIGGFSLWLGLAVVALLYLMVFMLRRSVRRIEY
jgi:hypothetical protein